MGESMPVAECLRYWGKARPVSASIAGIDGGEAGQPRCHLLVFHCLDVAACGAALIRLPQFSLQPLAGALGWTLEQTERLFVFFLALHDIGKFSRAFQGLAGDLSPLLVPVDRAPPYLTRHDTLGWFLWQSVRDEIPERVLPRPWHSFWAAWIRSVVGHHGLPPDESSPVQMDGGDPAKPHCRPGDREAVLQFIDAVSWLLPDPLPHSPSEEHGDVIRRFSWQLAGIAVLADWLGSDQASFRYRDQPFDLQAYWREVATTIAPGVIAAAGLAAQPARTWADPLQLFDYLREPTPLQRWAAEVPLQEGPQLYLLEDVTGAGKTEAALILTQRLLQTGLARGLYFALPSMATANQMYRRVGHAYRRLFDPDANPSLMLAHGARGLVEGFRDSVLQSRAQWPDRSYGAGEASATAQCNVWLASRQKLALLADVGVGTIDQVLLGVLPVRHQSLRLVGLASKVLVVDEVHAYDPYMHRLLQALLTAHAAQGGSVILLSATMPVRMRDELLRAFAGGRGLRFRSLLEDRRYPAALQAGSEVLLSRVDTRPSVIRSVAVDFLHDEIQVIERLLHESEAGRCVCWIRNTVGDARRTFADLRARGLGDRVQLFHSRFAMGDRLAIENDVLARFGKSSTADDRRGRILIATQVVEQSLDLDFDLLISDLAPIDLLIQRAGRLRRHVRDPDGNVIEGDDDRRAGLPVLLVHSPLWTATPAADWFSSVFPRAAYVYPDSYRLWLTQRALRLAGAIVSPGRDGEPGAVRRLVEAVYGPQDEDVPEGLMASQNKAQGARSGQRAQADFNAIDWAEGYMRALKAHWDDRGMAPTRLGDESIEIVLVEWAEGGLRPVCEDDRFAIELSTVRIAARRLSRHAGGLAEEIVNAIAALPDVIRGRIDAESVLPLVRMADGLLAGTALDGAGKPVSVIYDRLLGLRVGEVSESSVHGA